MSISCRITDGYQPIFRHLVISSDMNTTLTRHRTDITTRFFRNVQNNSTTFPYYFCKFTMDKVAYFLIIHVVMWSLRGNNPNTKSIHVKTPNKTIKHISDRLHNLVQMTRKICNDHRSLRWINNIFSFYESM